MTYGAVVMREFTWLILWMQTQRQADAEPQTRPTDLGCQTACWLLPSTPTISIYN